MFLRKVAGSLVFLMILVMIAICTATAYYINQQSPLQFQIASRDIVIGSIHYGSALLSGLFVGYPAGQMLGNLLRNRRWRRWMATSALSIYVVIVTLLTGRSAAIAGIPAIFGTFIITVLILRELYGGSYRNAITHHFTLMTGALKGFQIVEDGKMTVPSGGLVLGPRLLITRPGSAVLTIRANKQAVRGPGFHQTGEFEYAKDFFDLSEQQLVWRIKKIMTGERIQMNARARITYGIDIEPKRAFGDEPLDNDDMRKLMTLYREVPDWKGSTLDIAEQMLRDALATMNFQMLSRPHNLRRLGEQARAQTNVYFANARWPIVVNTFVIMDLQPSSEVIEAVSENWMEKQRAEAWRSVLSQMAQGLREGRLQGMKDADLHSQILRYTLDKLAKDPQTSVILNRELNDLMAILRT